MSGVSPTIRPSRQSAAPVSGHRARARTTLAAPTSRVPLTRRPSVSGLGLTGTINPVAGASKAQRTSKTIQKLVLLPTAPQTKPLLLGDEEFQHGYETDSGVRATKSEGERMSKDQRKKAGFKRITAYCVAEAFKMKLLASFLKREHNVQPRVFDEAMYVMYHLPLLPGYSPNSNIRSSASPTSEHADISLVSEAEDMGYPISAPSSPLISQPVGLVSPTIPTPGSETPHSPEREGTPAERSKPDDGTVSGFAEAVFFSYGVVVFFGFDEAQEHSILEDVASAGIIRRRLEEDNWEIEECHYAYDPHIAYPRIYNDFFTFKSHSTLLILSVSHAFAQSTLLAHYETITHSTLSSPQTKTIPQQLASTGSLHLSRTEALKQTGRLFKLRRDVNLVSNVLDVPELFWVEEQASLRKLYDAVREYMEIGSRVHVLNEKLAVAEDLLGAIHDHLNNNAMERITWIIIWLIVVACLVEVGEVIARLVFHASKGSHQNPSEIVFNVSSAALARMSKEEALRTLERIMNQQ